MKYLLSVFAFAVTDCVVYLVFFLEFLRRAELQQTHVDQPLQVFMKHKDVLPETKTNTHSECLISHSSSGFQVAESERDGKGRKSPFIKQLSFRLRRQHSNQVMLLHGVVEEFLYSIHLWIKIRFIVSVELFVHPINKIIKH